MAVDKRLTCSIVLCVFGVAFALSAAGLISVSVLRPLWTVWGRSETSRVVDSAILTLFQTEEEMLVEIGLDPNCSYYYENRTGVNRTQYTVKRWNCTGPTLTTTQLPFTGGYLPNQYVTSPQTRRKRQISDNDRSCSTELYLTRPITVPAGRRRGVARDVRSVEFTWTSPPRYQFIQEGGCQAPGICSATGGRCVLHSRVQPLLVSEQTIESKLDLVYAVYYDQVWFESYEFAGSCKCVG